MVRRPYDKSINKDTERSEMTNTGILNKVVEAIELALIVDAAIQTCYLERN